MFGCVCVCVARVCACVRAMGRVASQRPTLVAASLVASFVIGGYANIDGAQLDVTDSAYVLQRAATCRAGATASCQLVSPRGAALTPVATTRRDDTSHQHVAPTRCDNTLRQHVARFNMLPRCNTGRRGFDSRGDATTSA